MDLLNMTTPIFLTPEQGLQVDTSKIGRVDGRHSCSFGYNSQIEKDPVTHKRLNAASMPFEDILKIAIAIRARYILKTSSNTYYIKCYKSQRPSGMFTSGEILSHVSKAQSTSGKSRCWVLDY